LAAGANKEILLWDATTGKPLPGIAGLKDCVHQLKFSPDGKVLMRLGRAGVGGSGPDTLNQPNDVITAPNAAKLY
jgi:WD40 repeat protein